MKVYLLEVDLTHLASDYYCCLLIHCSELGWLWNSLTKNKVVSLDSLTTKKDLLKYVVGDRHIKYSKVTYIGKV